MRGRRARRCASYAWWWCGLRSCAGFVWVVRRPRFRGLAPHPELLDQYPWVHVRWSCRQSHMAPSALEDLDSAKIGDVLLCLSLELGGVEHASLGFGNVARVVLL